MEEVINVAVNELFSVKHFIELYITKNQPGRLTWSMLGTLQITVQDLHARFQDIISSSFWMSIYKTELSKYMRLLLASPRQCVRLDIDHFTHLLRSHVGIQKTRTESCNSLISLGFLALMSDVWIQQRRRRQEVRHRDNIHLKLKKLEERDESDLLYQHHASLGMPFIPKDLARLINSYERPDLDMDILQPRVELLQKLRPRVKKDGLFYIAPHIRIRMNLPYSDRLVQDIMEPYEIYLPSVVNTVELIIEIRSDQHDKRIGNTKFSWYWGGVITFPTKVTSTTKTGTLEYIPLVLTATTIAYIMRCADSITKTPSDTTKWSMQTTGLFYGMSSKPITLIGPKNINVLSQIAQNAVNYMVRLCQYDHHSIPEDRLITGPSRGYYYRPEQLLYLLHAVIDELPIAVQKELSVIDTMDPILVYGLLDEWIYVHPGDVDILLPLMDRVERLI